MNREDALEEGLRKGMKKGKKAVIEEMLRHVLSRHLRRELNPAERRALSARARTLSGPEVAELLANDGAASLLSSLLSTPRSDSASAAPSGSA